VWTGRKRRALAVALAVTVAAVGGTATAYALLGGTVPSQEAVTFSIPKTHLTALFSLPIGTYPTGGAASFPASATFAGTLQVRSNSGWESVHCVLAVGPTNRPIGVADQYGTGAILPSTAYPTASISMVGTFTASPGEVLMLNCATSQLVDGYLIDAHVVVRRVASQAGGV
jgi:hypothetical protein